MASVIQGMPVVQGTAQGTALVTDVPLSFWGGYDHHSGEITDRRHPLSGSIAAGRVLVVPFTRGSSTTTAVLLEAIKAGTAPAAIVTTNIDSFFALASIVADVMYASPIPIIVIRPEEAATLQTGDGIYITDDGCLSVNPSSRR
jgi:predicted aconitase with swiveling domain